MLENTKISPLKAIELEVKESNYERVNMLKIEPEPVELNEKKVEMMAGSAVQNEKKLAALKTIGRFVRRYLEKKKWIEMHSNYNPYVTGSVYHCSNKIWGTVNYLLRADPEKDHITLTIKSSGYNLIHIVDQPLPEKFSGPLEATWDECEN